MTRCVAGGRTARQRFERRGWRAPHGELVPRTGCNLWEALVSHAGMGNRSLLLALAVMGMAGAGPAAPAVAAEDEPRTVFHFDEQVTESSGLVDLGDRVLTINDSGDDAVVYVIDPRTGDTVGRTTFADEVTDVEAITQGPDGDVWVGDIGDNGGDRSGIRVHRIERPTDGDRDVASTTYELVYDGGARDAETLLVSPDGRLYVVSKGLFSGQVWVAPQRLATDRANLLRPVGDVGGMINDGAWFPDGSHVVLRDYDVAWVYDATQQPWRLLDRVNVPDLQQGEGVAVRRDGDLLISSEGSNQPVVQVPLSERLREQLQLSGDGRQDSSPRDEAAGGQEVPEDPGLDTLLRGDLRVTVLVVLVGLLVVYLVHRMIRLSR